MRSPKPDDIMAAAQHDSFLRLTFILEISPRRKKLALQRHCARIKWRAMRMASVNAYKIIVGPRRGVGHIIRISANAASSCQIT